MRLELVREGHDWEGERGGGGKEWTKIRIIYRLRAFEWTRIGKWKNSCACVGTFASRCEVASRPPAFGVARGAWARSYHVSATRLPRTGAPPLVPASARQESPTPPHSPSLKQSRTRQTIPAPCHVRHYSHRTIITSSQDENRPERVRRYSVFTLI